MMKNFFKSLMLVAVAAMAFTACQNDIDDVNAVSKGTTLTFTANLDTETRVAFGDADAEGIRKVTWEKGDLVSFIVYDDFNAIYDYVNDVEVKADGAIATFNVTFEKTIQTNYTIKAYVGKYVVNVGQEYNYGYDYYVVYDRGNSFTNQYPTDAGLTDVYLSAEVPYLGDDNVTITFGHDYAYGKMTVDYPVDFEEISVSFYNENWDSVYATIYGDDVKGKVFWFYCEEISDVNRVEITAYDAEDNEYVLSKNVDAAKNFRFEKGLISSFSVKDFVQKLSNPEVTGTIVDNKAVFTWNAVEHATSYDVYVNYELVKEAYTGTSYEVSLDGYTPFSDVTITVEVNPEDGYIAPESGADASVVVPITKDAKGTHELVFDVCSPVENFNNTYKFTQSTEMEGYSVDNFMYLRFNEAIITSGSALYNHDHLKRTTSGWNTVYSDSCFWMAEALRPAGSHGYSDTYNPYNYKSEVFTIYPNYGDACAIYVDVEGDTYTFTVFVKNNGFFGSENLFKGTWTGKLDGSVEPEPEPEEVAIVSAVATTPADISFSSATVRDVTFTYNNGDVLMIRFATLGKDYIVPGTWQTDDYTSPNYINLVQLNGESIGLASWITPFTVGYESGAYTFAGSIIVSYSPFTTMDFSYTGPVGNLVKPVIEEGGEPEEPESSASAALVTDTTFNGFNPYDVTFSFANGDKVVARFNTSGNQYLHLGAWQANNWQEPHYISLVKLNGEEAYVSACNVAYENNAYTVTLSVFEYTNYTTINYTYTGAIVGLYAPEACDCFKEPEQPEGGLPNCKNLTLQLCQKEPFISSEGFGYGDIRLVDSEGKYYINIEVNDQTLYTYSYVFVAGYEDYDAGNIYAPNTYVSYKGAAWDDSTADTPAVASGNFDIVVDGANCTIDIDFVLEDGNEFSGSYAGVLPY